MNSPYIAVQRLEGSDSESIFWLCQFNSYKTELLQAAIKVP